MPEQTYVGPEKTQRWRRTALGAFSKCARAPLCNPIFQTRAYPVRVLGTFRRITRFRRQVGYYLYYVAEWWAATVGTAELRALLQLRRRRSNLNTGERARAKQT